MLYIPITDPSSVGQARRAISKHAALLGFSEHEIANLCIIVVEAANNLINHKTVDGEIVFSSYSIEGDYGIINIYALDKGPGITNVAQCLSDGYSTNSTQGAGLGAIKRLSSDFDIYSHSDSGTVLWSQMIFHYPSQQKVLASVLKKQQLIDIGNICVPIKGEQLCGDGIALDFNSSQPLFMVVDGLGHGDGAFNATQSAINIFNEHKSKGLPLENFFHKMHLALRKTRGAAAAICKINLLNNSLEYIGVGNISGVILERNQRRGLISSNGIVGHIFSSPQVFHYPLSDHFILVMHSDGIVSRWGLEKYPALMNKQANIIAGVIYRDYRRDRDDTTVLVIKPFI